jgi:hypothetical protein
VAAQVNVDENEMRARNVGFEKLAGYIFGGNHARQSIAMTAPVAQSPAQGSQSIAMTAPVSQMAAGNGTWRIRFFMPAKYTLAQLPVPNDPSVSLVEVPAEVYAVLRFSGSRDANAIKDKTTELRDALAGSRWHPTGTPVAWFYDPPWTLPFLRRNEVAIPVATGP